MQKKIKKIILWILLLILALNIFGCSNSEENIDLSQIVVNTRKDSHKIHRISCAYVDKMAEHNKWYPNKTIEELISEGYEPCDICLAKTYKKYINGEYSKKNNDISGTTKVLETLVGSSSEINKLEKKKTNEETLIDCIKDVAEYYLNNVYTYQGAHKNKYEIEEMAKNAYSEAYNKWNSEKSKYNDKEFAMKSANDDKDAKGNYLNNDALYVCKKINDIDIKGNYITDDCSKFVACVYFYYLKSIGKGKEANQISVAYEGSSKFSNVEAKMNKLLSKCKFKTYSMDDIKYYDKEYEKGLKASKFTLKAGDMIYRRQYKRSDGTIKPAHVEFVIDESHVFGWGQVQSQYPVGKTFSKSEKGFYSDYNKDEGLPYILVIRLEDE